MNARYKIMRNGSLYDSSDDKTTAIKLARCWAGEQGGVWQVYDGKAIKYSREVTLEEELWERLESAIELAVVAYKDQAPRADGTPRITHSLRVAFRAIHGSSGEKLRLATVALLHDVVEDTDVTLAALKKNFPLWAVEAVEVLSRKEDEPYMQFIERVAKNDLARQIKILDINDNMRDMDMTASIPEPVERVLEILNYRQRKMRLRRKD